MTKRNDDSTVARIAGNIASGLAETTIFNERDRKATAKDVVSLARAIVAEVERTEPKPEQPLVCSCTVLRGGLQINAACPLHGVTLRRNGTVPR